MEPWKIARESDPEAKARLNWVIYRCAEALRIAGIFLQPIMPSKSRQLLDSLGVRPDRRTAAYAVQGADLEYGTAPPVADPSAAKQTAWDALFPPLPGVELGEMDAVSNLHEDKKLKKSGNRLNRLAARLAEESRQGVETK